MTTEQTPIKAGATVYDKSGRSCEYIQAVAGGHLIRTLVESDDWGDECEPWYDQPRWVDRVETEPREVRINAEVKEARAELDRLKGLQREARNGIANTERQIKKFRALSPAFDALEALIDRKVTHIVHWDSYSSGNRIDSFSYDKHIEFSIYFKPDGSVEFEQKKTPCTSREQAVAILHDKMIAYIERSLAGRVAYPSALRVRINEAQKSGATIPANILEKVEALEAAVKQKAIGKAKADLAKLEAVPDSP